MKQAVNTFSIGPIAALLAAALLSSCSSRQLYQTGQNWQRLECQKIPDATERDKCLAANSASYDDFRRQSEAAKKNP